MIEQLVCDGEVAPDAILLVDQRGRIERLCDHAQGLFGYDRAELIGQPVNVLLPFSIDGGSSVTRPFGDDVKPPVPAAVARETVGIRKDGNRMPMSLQVTPLESGHGASALYRVRNRAGQGRTENTYRSLLNSTPDALVLVNAAGQIVLINLQTEKLFGYTTQELLGRQIEALIPDRFHAQHQEYRVRYLLDPQVRPMGTRPDVFGLRKDGSEFCVEISLSPFVTDEGVFVCCAIRDVTVRQRAEQALRDAEKKIRSLMQTVPDFITEWDRDGRILFINRLAEGFVQEEVIGRSALEFIPAAYQDRIRAALQRVFASGDTVEVENEGAGASGDWRWYMTRIAPLRLDHQVTSALVVATDITERKRAEFALRANEERFRTLVEQASDGIFISDAEGRYVDVNSAGAAMLAYSCDDVLRLSIADVVAPWETTRIEPELRRLFGGQAARSEWQFRRKDGSLFFGEVNARQLSDTRILGIVRDVSERKQAHLALAASEQLLRDFIRYTPAAIAILDADLRYLQVSERWIKDYHLENQVLVGRHHYEVFPEIPERWKQIHRRALAGQVEHSDEDSFLRLDGTLEWLQWEIRPWYKPTGEQGGVIFFTQVITERKNTQSRLQESQAHLLASQRVARIGSWELDLVSHADSEHKPLRWTDECYRIFGYEPGTDRATSAAFWARVHPDDQQRVRDTIRHALATRSVYELQHRIILPNGAQRIISERAELVIDPETKAPVKWIGTTQDVTEHHRLEEQLRQSQKMQAIGQLAGGVAHDFNNLLTVINGYASLLLDTPTVAEPNREPLAAIRDAADRAALLTRQLLLFSRKAVLEAQILDLNVVLQQASTLLRRLIGEDIVLTTVFAPTLKHIKADPGQVEQVIMNLALNARDAMPRGGRLTIETRDASISPTDCLANPDCKPGRFVRLLVSDTGCGMSPEVKGHLFEPFFTTKEIGKGTGLGLATVYAIVRSNGGFITVLSEINEGTTISVYLPAFDDGSTSLSSETMDREVLHGTETILLVEDEESVRRFVRILLEKQGYTLLEARSGAEALAEMEKHSEPIDLLVTDVVMPGMGGRQLAEVLCARHSKLKVLFISGYNEDAMIRNDVLAATSDYLQKPFSPLALARKVREVLNQSR